MNNNEFSIKIKKDDFEILDDGGVVMHFSPENLEELYFNADGIEEVRWKRNWHPESETWMPVSRDLKLQMVQEALRDFFESACVEHIKNYLEEHKEEIEQATIEEN
jgi:hypothetical protein